MQDFEKTKSCFNEIMKKFIADKTGKLSKLALNSIDDLSYSAFMKALRKKDVKVNGKRVISDCAVSVGDTIEIYYTSTEQIKFDVVYQDENVLVVNKKCGFTSESVFESVKQQFDFVCFIHRLDRNTSGLMIFALNETAEKELLFGFKERTFDKYYLATVVGVPKLKTAMLTAYLFKDQKNSLVTITDKLVKGSVKIKTGYTVVEENAETSVLKVTLYTGKTHQIRAHLAHIGHPIVGDSKYGDFAFNQKSGVKYQKLIASELILHFDKQSPLYYLNNMIFKV